ARPARGPRRGGGRDGAPAAPVTAGKGTVEPAAAESQTQAGFPPVEAETGAAQAGAAIAQDLANAQKES
ncbi:MAG: hypothetical protein M3P91_10030, partial [Actinomycetota bacterium]|nr:hypothetical protein [Actinomycetota bacterium]